MVVIVSDTMRRNITKWLLYLDSIHVVYLRACEREYVGRSMLVRGLSRWRNGSCYRYVGRNVADRLLRDRFCLSLREGYASIVPERSRVIVDGTFSDSYSPSEWLAITSLYNSIPFRAEYAPGVLREMCDDFWTREGSRSGVGELSTGLHFTLHRRRTVILHVYLRVGNRAVKYEIKFVLMSGGGYYDINSWQADPL
jgi:hypothetical protein